uniref:Uncharacterized protein n=1 Tax=Ditylenchus dipsaci TaxID=166011 RepID=A0A915EKJ5_9BILA
MVEDLRNLQILLSINSRAIAPGQVVIHGIWVPIRRRRTTELNNKDSSRCVFTELMMKILHSFRSIFLGWLKHLQGPSQSSTILNFGEKSVLSASPLPQASSSTDSISNKMQKATTIIRQLSSNVRQPMIKFVGARLPRPHFDPSSQNHSSSSVTISRHTPSKKASSARQVVLESPLELPARYRRREISEDEIATINSGGFFRGI